MRQLEVWPSSAEGSGGGGLPSIDERLRELGIWRLRVPTPFAGEPSNVYAIEDEGGGLAILDTGVSGRVAYGALAEGLWRLGAGFSDVTRILVTHGHADHFGAARWLIQSARRDVPVFAHPADHSWMTAPVRRFEAQLPHYQALFERHGVPRDVFLKFAHREMSYDRYACELREVRPLGDGEVLRFGRFEATVLHLPGHTPGLVCLFDAAHGLLFSSDHLFETVTPGLELYLGPGGEDLPFRSLARYLDSLRITRTLDVRAVLPGHGAPFGGCREAIDTVLRIQAERQTRILEVLSRGPTSAFAMARTLFPRTAAAEPMATLAQIVGHLEILQARGVVVSEGRNDAQIYWTIG